MPTFNKPLPLSLYIHLPWCVRKCPYCDFNSHELKETLPESQYVNALLEELNDHLPLIQDRPIISIFFGGGTPSLFSPQAIEIILKRIQQQINFSPSIEITLEANPGTVDERYFQHYHHAGINRLSLGIQSFNNEKLQALGRIHNRDHAISAIEIAKQAGFNNFNLDLMYGLPQQSLEEALEDLRTALSFHLTHLSWYQLTIEPNTLFYKQKPSLPVDEELWEIQCAGQALLQIQDFNSYEVSAYAKKQYECLHNKNYWTFGDYLGIGAGAHSKITDTDQTKVIRFSQVKHPRDYLNRDKRKAIQQKIIDEKTLIFEFMLNALRLAAGVSWSCFSERTGLNKQCLESLLAIAYQRGLLIEDPLYLCPTPLGKRFLNDLIEIFLP